MPVISETDVRFRLSGDDLDRKQISLALRWEPDHSLTDRSPDDDPHYHFRVSLRIRHPDTDPERITKALGMQPRRAWKAGERRQTPMGRPLHGTYSITYWYIDALAGRYSGRTLDAGIRQILDGLSSHRDFFHTIRSEHGSAELFIGWFFGRQSGDVFTHETLAKAADLKLDLSFDIYPPPGPQGECEIADHA